MYLSCGRFFWVHIRTENLTSRVKKSDAQSIVHMRPTELFTRQGQRWPKKSEIGTASARSGRRSTVELSRTVRARRISSLTSDARLARSTLLSSFFLSRARSPLEHSAHTQLLRLARLIFYDGFLNTRVLWRTARRACRAYVRVARKQKAD